MMKFIVLCISALAFWSKLAVSQDLPLASTLSTVIATPAADEQPISTSIASASTDVSVPDISANATDVALNEKEIRLHCGPLSLILSEARKNVWYLKASCSGVWNTLHTTRCSYLDLNLCYLNTDGRIKPGPQGGFGPSCFDCKLFQDRGNNMMKCNCDQGHDEDNLVESTVNLDDLLTVENGFLSCYGMTNFECPPPGEDV